MGREGVGGLRTGTSMDWVWGQMGPGWDRGGQGHVGMGAHRMRAHQIRAHGIGAHGDGVHGIGARDGGTRGRRAEELRPGQATRSAVHE